MAVSNLKKKKHTGLTSLLYSAACEWLLIILLFADAFFTHLIAKFASYCELHAPCPICTRLDHIFGKNKHDHYWNLVCTKHREEISSLDSKKPPEPNPVFLFGPSKPNAKTSLLREPGKARISRRKILIDKFARKTTYRRKGIDALSDGGCNKFRISSDFESEFPFSDNDDGYASCSCGNYGIPIYNIGIGIRKNVVPDKEQTHHGSEMESQPELISAVVFEPSEFCAKPPLSQRPDRARISRWKIQIDKSSRKKTHRCKSFDTLSGVGCGKMKISSDSELEFPFPDDNDGYASCSGSNYIRSAIADFVSGIRKNIVLDKEQTWHDSEIESQPDLSPVVVFGPSKPNSKPPLSRRPGRARISRRKILIDKFARKTTHRRKSIDTLSDVGYSKTKTSSDSESEFPFSEDDDGYASCSGSNYITPTINDIIFGIRKNMVLDKEQAYHGSEIKSQPNLPESETLSNKYINIARNEQDKGTLSASLKRNDSSYGSLNGILSIGNIEGESIIDRLKRQVEHDRNCINCIYKELEEERNAASIAANEAMTMITRLQEEKAELRMEALQYLRMMEEQSEYDIEALRRSNDLLADKEKELQDLEYELESYRNSMENHFPACFGNGLGDSSDLKSA